jgi:hypothetical protein
MARIGAPSLSRRITESVCELVVHWAFPWRRVATARARLLAFETWEKRQCSSLKKRTKKLLSVWLRAS